MGNKRRPRSAVGVKPARTCRRIASPTRARNPSRHPGAQDHPRWVRSVKTCAQLLQQQPYPERLGVRADAHLEPIHQPNVHQVPCTSRRRLGAQLPRQLHDHSPRWSDSTQAVLPQPIHQCGTLHMMPLAESPLTQAASSVQCRQPGPLHC